jgi:hypothetical protein
LSTTEQDDTRQFVETTFPDIHYNPDPHAVYRRGAIVGEHGHRYALFNAPNTLPQIPLFLAIGYFMSRLEADRSLGGRKEDYLHILSRFALEFLIHKAGPVRDLFIAMAHDAKLGRHDLFNMSGLEEFPVNEVEAIGTLYDPLLEKWPQKPHYPNWRQAMVGDTGHLILAAVVAHFADDASDQNIVIFGHSHHAELWKSYDLPLLNFLARYFFKKHFNKILDDLKKELPIPDLGIWDCLKAHPMVPSLKLPFHLPIKIPCRSIYVNCGSWVDIKPCTYVETQEDAEKERHYVRLLSYHPTRKLLREEYVKLKN